ncbi:UV-stimulated scaffold protein A isoform X1 [Crotalus tigris]|uniref:UV-stimulated scaffold protein A isoform X1 n=2 Tax=Crotalus tigris TaxID=88082 RepID=UPI00192F73FC|nr:UV-stimulated scaffold protein A isoform X1 [Crotalus tigris]
MESSGAGMDQQLAQLVEDLTTSGEPQLDPKKMKALKNICRCSDEHINHVYHLLMSQLNQEHAEIRLSAFQIVDQLFARSHLFRTLLVSNFQEFLELTVETNYDRPLPPPTEVAQKLKKAAIQSVQEWHEKYGEAYKKLSLGYYFLKQNKKVDFQDVHARTLAERKRAEERQKRLDNIYKDKAQKAEKEMKDTSEEMQSVLTQLDSCFQLLVPDPLDFTFNGAEIPDWRRREAETNGTCSSAQVANQPGASMDHSQQPCCSKDLPHISLVAEDSDRETEKDQGLGDSFHPGSASLGLMEDDDPALFLRSHGLGSYKYALSLEVSSDVKLSENEDNAAIINNLSDSFKLITNKFLPLVQSWIQLFTRAGISDDRLRQAIDLKNKLEAALEKTKKMNIDFQEKKTWMKSKEEEEEEEEEEEFVEVPEKEGFEPQIPDHLREEYSLEPVLPTRKSAVGTGKNQAVPMRSPFLSQSVIVEEELDPTSAAATWKVIRDKLPRLPTAEDKDCKPTTSKEANRQREEEKAKAPLVPFGIDLFYWGQEQPTSGKILRFSSQHRFWAPSEVDEEVENKELSEMLKSRYITYAGRFEPVTHKCRAPMPNGSLCERQDRFKCPFHGKIVPRDESGNPLNQEDRDREAKEQFEKKEQQPEWQDPNFMREVEAATGVDLGSSQYDRKAKGGKKRGKAKKKYPNLTDLKQKANTPRSRLGKKVFNKGAVKRIVKAMNRIDQRKHEKFANQFNYALN